MGTILVTGSALSEKRTEDLKTGSERMGLDVMNALDIISGERIFEYLKGEYDSSGNNFKEVCSQE